MEGFSNDNYIINQEFFGAYRYRTMSSKYNGCGWIAAYNLRKALGQQVSFTDVLEEMDSMHKIKMRGPTLMRVMRKYMKKYIPNFKEAHGKSNSILAAKQSKAGIFRYYEEYIPHFVTFVKQDDGLYRFFNVNEGEMQDFCSSIDDFAKVHFNFGTYIALTV